MRIRTVVARSFTLAAITALGSVTACGGAEVDKAAKTPATASAHLLALSTYSASLGTPIDAFMENPPPSTARAIELVFDGVFARAGGGEDRVSITQAATRTDAGAIRWTSFGPFGNPFTPTNPDIGTFRGKVGVKVTNQDGTVTTDANPLTMQFEVKPSIILTELQPRTANCDHPAYLLIGLMSYKMKAQALGFKATNIEYSFKTPGVELDTEGQPAFVLDAQKNPQFRTTTFSHEVSTPIDTVDGNDVLTLPPVPSGVQSYGVIFNLTARDEAGRTVRSTFGMTAHKPLEVYDDGRYTLAQVYPAEPVSGCIPGGQQGRQVGYDESTSEQRTRALSLTLSRSWLKSDENNWSTTDGKSLSQGKTTSDSFSRTHGTTNSFDFQKNGSTSHTVDFNWSDQNMTGANSGWNVNGSASVDIKVVTLGGGGGYESGTSSSHTSSKGGGTSDTTTNGWSQGTSNSTSDSTTNDHTTSTTDTASIEHSDTKGGSNTEQQGGGQDQNESWTVSSTDTISKTFQASVIANTYGVFYRQMARYTRRAFVVEYNKCGESDVVGDVTLQNYVWAPDLALSESCGQTLPTSNFPKPQCFLAPCDP